MLQYQQIVAAQQAIQAFVHRTPMVRSQTLSSRWNTNVYLKLECLQKTGSFKPRGAFNKLLHLQSQGGQGTNPRVVGVSGGNHAQGLAYAARTLGMHATICMPETTPRNYLDATRGYGAEIVLLPNIHEAFKHAANMQQQGWVYVHPFDDELVAAGQGTLALEILEDLPDVTHCFVSIGGGGLISGIAMGLKRNSDQKASTGRPDGPRVIGVETVGADCMWQAMQAGRLVELPAITSIARTLGSPSASQMTLDIVSELVDELQVVSDAESLAELFFVLERCKILIEPAAACCVAAAHRKSPTFQPSDNIVILLCGGNVSSEDLVAWHAAQKLESEN